MAYTVLSNFQNPHRFCLYSNEILSGLLFSNLLLTLLVVIIFEQNNSLRYRLTE